MPRRPTRCGDGECCKRCVARSLLIEARQALARKDDDCTDADACGKCIAIRKLHQAAVALVESSQGLGEDYPALQLVKDAHEELVHAPGLNETIVEGINKAVDMLKAS